MHARVQFFAILGSVGLLVLIFELVRKRKLKEKYSLVWLLTALALLAVSAIPGLLDGFGKFLGIYYSPSAFFLIAFFFLMSSRSSSRWSYRSSPSATRRSVRMSRF